jgi:hypothetical protein
MEVVIVCQPVDEGGQPIEGLAPPAVALSDVPEAGLLKMAIQAQLQLPRLQIVCKIGARGMHVDLGNMLQTLSTLTEQSSKAANKQQRRLWSSASKHTFGTSSLGASQSFQS